MTIYIGVAAGLIVLLFAYVRLVPHDIATVHQDFRIAEDLDDPGGVWRKVKVPAEELHEVILREPRTIVLAGSPDEGRTTYVTRSAFWGFPDYTTVVAKKNQSHIHARLRFGKSDLGVNSARVERWLSHLNTRDY
ncbi:MAG: DUF1499 domain-containing protein [Pseudomonadota bacterium]|nr:DUF1499 domain-containing protein [Pseudomonadota bacterium]